MKQKTVNVALLKGHGIWDGEGCWADRKVKAWASEALAERDWWGYVWCYKNPWRLDAFLTIENHMSDRAYWSLLGHVWLDCEDPHQRLRHWVRLWQSSRPHQELVMHEEERNAFTAKRDSQRAVHWVHITPAEEKPLFPLSTPSSSRPAEWESFLWINVRSSCP